jgi:hypothetical protein
MAGRRLDDEATQLATRSFAIDKRLPAADGNPVELQREAPMARSTPRWAAVSLSPPFRKAPRGWKLAYGRHMH